MKERVVGIDILKCFAALLITNSHLKDLYVHGSAFATGGSVGDALFFFCSGYTLSVTDTFIDWYKKRILRIYPVIIVWGLFTAFLFDPDYSVRDMVISGGGWFVSAIMVYYIIFYAVNKYLKCSYWYVLSLYIIGGILIFLKTNSGENIFSGGFFRLYFFFSFMLLGYKVKTAKLSPKIKKAGISVCILLLMLASFYGLQLFCLHRHLPNYMQLLLIPILCGICVFFFFFSNSLFLVSKYKKIKSFHWLVDIVGGLTLEIYVVQHRVITTDMNSLFPMNILLMMCLIIVSAYVLRCGGKLFLQLWDNEPLNTKALFRGLIK